MKFFIDNATIIDPNSPFHLKKTKLFIENGIICKIGDSIKNEKGAEVINLENLHISKGWFDSSTSFGEPGFEERENLRNGLYTAAKSGFTSVAINSNTAPVTSERAHIAFIKNASQNSGVQVKPIGALTQGSKGIDLAELFDMHQEGVSVFYDYNKGQSNANLLKIALQYVKNFGGNVASFPLDSSISNRGVMNEGETSTILGLKGIPALAEIIQVKRDIDLLAYTQSKLHIPTISLAKSIESIQKAKEKGLQISSSVSIFNLWFNDQKLDQYDTNFKVLPPLRNEEDVIALREALKEGIVDMVTSNHNPIDIENKNIEFDKAAFGSIGLECVYGVVNALFGKEKAVEILTRGKAMFGIKNTSIEEGQPADITLFNPDLKYTFQKQHIISKSKNCMFLGVELRGKVYGVIANGKAVL